MVDPESSQQTTVIDQNIQNTLNIAVRNPDAGLTHSASINIAAEGDAIPSAYSDKLNDFRRLVQAELDVRERSQKDIVSPVTQDKANAILTPSASVKETFHKIDAISPDAAKTFLALDAYEKEQGSRDVTKPDSGMTVQLQGLLAWQVDDAIGHHGKDKAVQEAVRNFLGDTAMAEVKQYQKDYSADSISPKTVQEGQSLATRIVKAAQQAIDAGITGGHAQLTEPAQSGLPAQAKARDVSMPG